jgi:hypothetical protein
MLFLLKFLKNKKFIKKNLLKFLKNKKYLNKKKKYSKSFDFLKKINFLKLLDSYEDKKNFKFIKLELI